MTDSSEKRQVSSNSKALLEEIARWIRTVRDDVFEHGNICGRTQRSGEDLLRRIDTVVMDSGSHETLYVGCPVTYSPLYPSQMPRDGWTIDRLPPELTHIIRHPSGSVIAVTAREIQPAQKASE